MVIKIENTEKKVSLSVHDLISLYFDQGKRPIRDIGPSNPIYKKRRQIGTKVHTEWQQEQSEILTQSFKREYYLRVEFPHNKWTFIIRGRIDGLTGGERDDIHYVDELKSVATSFQKLIDQFGKDTWIKENYPSYVFQLQLYLYLLRFDSQFSSKTLIGRIILINIKDQERISYEVDANPLMETIVRNVLGGIITSAIARVEEEKESQRIENQLKFPFESLRRSQEQIIGDIGRAIVEKSNLGVCAPTGIGKTVSALFPALTYALTSNRTVFYSTAKNSQQVPVFKSMKLLLNSIPVANRGDLQTVFIIGKEQMCINEVFTCHASSCRYLERYTERLDIDRISSELLKSKFGSLITVKRLKEAGERYQLCPFELALDLSLSCRMIVGDYNYVFDPAVYLRRHFGERNGSPETLLIVDEAHNLPKRA
ncbi:MAG TPA: hypothetical protein VJ044_14470, partial [Candidatus Hodarchaeales archaeon]|nr:hypothetical protein [Candidatus Hodarchaeales archaeon]